MHKVSALCVGATLLTVSTTAVAATPFDTVVVTATRTPQALSRTGDSISVITAADLRAQQIISVSDALKEVPGVTIVRNGGPGQTTTIGLRGADAGQTLILIDGVRINDPSTVDDQALLGDLLVNDIQRIEVLRGPQSTLYGSDAIGGVVNILTKRGGPNPFALTASAEGGSFDTYRLNAAANGTLHNFDYGAAVNYFHTNGISAADARNGNPETDGSGNLGLTANLRYHVTSALSLDLRSYYIRTRTDTDGYPPPTYTLGDTPQYNENRLFVGYAGVNLALLDGHFRNRFAVTETSANRKYFGAYSSYPVVAYIPGESADYRGRVTRFEYQGVVNVDPANQLTFGAETQRSVLRSHSSNYASVSGHNRTSGYYLQGQTTLLNQLTLTGGVRYDDDQEFGGHSSFKLAAAWTPDGGTTVLRANYGDGFKAPSLYQLYSTYSNPLVALRPETARGWEVGIDHAFWHDAIRASATYFDRHTRNLIDYFSCYGVTSPACALRSTAGGYYYNVGRSRAYGVELSVQAALSDTVSFGASYTNMHAVDEITHTDLLRRPHDLASAHATWQVRKDWSLGAAILYVGRQLDTDPVTYMTIHDPSHVTTNLYVTHNLGDNVELFARIENLFNVHYEPVAGYGAPGRAVYGGIRLRN